MPAPSLAATEADQHRHLLPWREGWTLPAPEHPTPGISRIRRAKLIAMLNASEQWGRVMGWRDKYKVHPAADVFPDDVG